MRDATDRRFSDMVRARAERDSAFREALLQETVQALLQGAIDDGRACNEKMV